MAVSRPGRGSDQFPLRLPDGMRERLKDEAEQNSRSMNAEIVARLEQTLSPDLLKLIEDLQHKKLLAEVRAEVYGELVKALIGILLVASGTNKQMLGSISSAVRSLDQLQPPRPIGKIKDGEDRTFAKERKEALEQLAKIIAEASRERAR
jgi:hypothetical protein